MSRQLANYFVSRSLKIASFTAREPKKEKLHSPWTWWTLLVREREWEKHFFRLFEHWRMSGIFQSTKSEFFGPKKNNLMTIFPARLQWSGIYRMEFPVSIYPIVWKEENRKSYFMDENRALWEMFGMNSMRELRFLNKNLPLSDAENVNLIVVDSKKLWDA